MKSKFERYRQIWQNKVVTRALSDPAFKEQLLRNPNQTLQQMGIEMPKGVTFHIHENTEYAKYLVLPQKPDHKLSEEELARVFAAGAGIEEVWG